MPEKIERYIERWVTANGHCRKDGWDSEQRTSFTSTQVRDQGQKQEWANTENTSAHTGHKDNMGTHAGQQNQKHQQDDSGSGQSGTMSNSTDKDPGSSDKNIKRQDNSAGGYHSLVLNHSP